MRCAKTCYSPIACQGFGYCRERNVEAGGMRNVSPEQQAEWKKTDNEKGK